MDQVGANIPILKASQKLFNSVISINLQTNAVKGSSLNVIVLYLLGIVLGLEETDSWQGTMKREVFTDLYRWLRGSELAPRNISSDSVQS